MNLHTTVAVILIMAEASLIFIFAALVAGFWCWLQDRKDDWPYDFEPPFNMEDER
jgi:hypothetical protein